MDKVHDCIIVGSGPAGMAAAIYLARYKIDCIVIGKEFGGTVNMASDIENWPGFKGPGWQLMDKFKEHVESFGVPMVMGRVGRITKDGDLFKVSTEGEAYHGKTVILAMGTERRKLNVPGEEEFQGKGVSHCATCDCVFFKEKAVAVIGGSDAAAMAAQILSQHAKKVYIIYRGESMRAEAARVEELEHNNKVEFIYNTNIIEIAGEKVVEKVKLDNNTFLPLDGVFIEIGGIPLTQVAQDIGVELSKGGRIIVKADMSTNMAGVFAAGDITTGSNEFNQIATAVGEGSIAALSVFNFIKGRKHA